MDHQESSAAGSMWGYGSMIGVVGGLACFKGLEEGQCLKREGSEGVVLSPLPLSLWW